MLFPCMDSSAYIQTYVLVLDAPIICFPFQFVKKKQESASINWQKCSVQVLHRSVLYRAIGACWKIAFSSIAQCIRLSYTKPVRRKSIKKSAVRMETRLQGGCKGTDVLIFRRSFCQINGHFVAPYGSSLSKFDFSCSNNSYSNHFLAYFILSDTIMNVLAKN